MILVYKLTTFLFLISVGVVLAVMGIREFRLTATKLSSLKKIGKSMKIGLLFTVSIFSFFCTIYLFILWDSLLEIDIQPALSIFICVLIPCWIVITTGVFVQISYLQMLIHSKKK